MMFHRDKTKEKPTIELNPREGTNPKSVADGRIRYQNPFFNARIISLNTFSLGSFPGIFPPKQA
jgi:hypothetical protein